MGCSREKKTDFELGKSYFLASNYPESSIRLEKWVSKKKNPNLEEAYAMLAVIYHDMPNRQAEYEKTMQTLKELGEKGMSAVVKLMENPTTASRLQNTIGDILIKSGSISIAPLMEHFNGANWRLKVYAQQILMQMGETAIPALTNALNSPDRFTKSMAIEALSKIGSQDIIPIIEQKLNDPDKLVQVTTAVALHAMGKQNPTEIILNSLNDPDVDVRRTATRAMSQGFDNIPVNRLLPLLKDADADVRNNATIALGKSKSSESVQALVKEMEIDENEQVRNSAGKALEAIGEPAVDPMISLLKRTDDMELIIRIAQILGNIGDKRAVEPLENIYKKEKRELIKNEIAKALNKID
jgi:HEAT repeat protein